MSAEPCTDVRIGDLEKSEGGDYGGMFQFHNALVWSGDRAVATGTGETVPFVCVDIDGTHEDGTLAVLVLRLDWHSAERARDALTVVLAGSAGPR